MASRKLQVVYCTSQLVQCPLRASYDDVLVLTKPATERCECCLLLWIDPLVGLIGWQDCEWLKVGLC